MHGGIIITGSHNPQEWNGLKLLSTRTFLDNNDLEIISNHLKTIDLNSYKTALSDSENSVKSLNPITNYVQDLLNYIDYREVKSHNNLKVVIDTGAGAGKLVTPKVLSELGCDIKLINDELLINEDFPREIEPIKQNLTDLIMEVWQGKYDIGFAHDTDADRLAIIGENGVCYPENIGLALITEYYLKNQEDSNKEICFVTNLASSLRFEAIAEKYNARIIRTPIGERFLTLELENLILKSPKNQLVFGGEGSCGGFMFPYFNNTRDGIFAAAKIVEILVKTGENVSNLVAELPKYYSHRIKISIKNVDTKSIIKKLKNELIDEGEEVEQVNNDLRFGQGMDWFVLIHPSNTEPVIRIISEAKRESLARVYCEATAELVKLTIS
ncbi:Phosphoglucosamine mutase [subsurface metagenome]